MTVTRTQEEIAKTSVDLGKLCGLNDWTMAIDGFMDPFVTCCFVSETKVFVNLFHNDTLTHYHMIIDTTTSKMVGNFVKVDIGGTRKNFPYKCFYDDEDDKVYSFYR